MFDSQLEFLKKTRHTLPEAIRYGVMLEVPSLAEMLDVLIPKIGFISIGTNDLTQFLFAADRANPKLAERYDWVSPAILRFLRRVVAATVGHPVHLGVCGEMGGRRLEALALLGIGITRLSITPAAVGPIKAMVRSAELLPLREAMQDWLAEGRVDIRDALGKAADAQGIVRN